MEYICKNNGIYSKELWHILGYDYRLFSGIYLPKVWDILGNNYGIYYGIFWLKMVAYIFQYYGIYWSFGYIKQKLWDILGKIVGYIGHKLGIS